MRKRIAAPLLVALVAAGCGGGSGSAERTTTTKTRAERDQANLERAHELFVDRCENSGGVDEEVFAELASLISTIVWRRPDEELPNGSTPRQMADELVAALDETEVCFTEVEVLNMFLAPD